MSSGYDDGLSSYLTKYPYIGVESQVDNTI